ncbi:MAG: hypothetical protein LBL93_07535 [Ruminococcus sp.]|jgi:vacuolar-type H+-ATPase subunit E/Vma4|nr:hypothetical protein [Ruminococcus sp.]
MDNLKTRYIMAEQIRLEKFGKSVSIKTADKIKSLEKETENKKKEILGAAENDGLTDSYNKLQSAENAVKYKVMQDTALSESEFKSKVLSFRKELTSKLFDEVLEKIKEFTASDRYVKYLARLLDGVKDGAVILVREADIKFKPDIEKITGKTFDFEPDATIHLGGISVKNGTHIENNTIDRALVDEKKNFTKNYNLF